MINVLRLTAFFVLATATTFIQSVSAFPISIHGTACQPANLNQALSLGLGWSQIGSTNNAPLGSSPFFITCPIILEKATMITSTYVSIEKLNPAAIQSTCTIFRQGFVTPTITAFNIPLLDTFNAISRLELLVSIPLNTTLGDSANIVCAVFPQTRIRQIAVYDNG